MGDRPLVFVTGMGRSGTSVVCRWLEHCGVDFGSANEVVAHINPDGNFEDRELMDLHLGIYGDNGFRSWLDVPLGHEWVVSAERRDTARAVAQRLSAGSAGTVGGIKNPLAAGFVPMWAELLPSAVFVAVHRPVEQVVDSALRLRMRNQDNRRNRVVGKVRSLHYRRSRTARDRVARDAARTWTWTNLALTGACEALPPDRRLVIDMATWEADAAAILAGIESRSGVALDNRPVSDIVRSGYFKDQVAAVDLGDLGPHVSAVGERFAALAASL